MKKKYYIILQPSIRTMGGEEMYTRNKIISARDEGYVPIVFHSGIGGDTVYIEDLKPYNKFEFSTFRYEPCAVSSRKKRHLKSKIKAILSDYDEECIIESHEVLIAEWGEWIASQLGIRHFAYMLLEHNTLSFKPLYDFFRFKYERHELAGIVNSTIPNMFQNFCENVQGYRLPAYCSNVYESIPCPKQFVLRKADYTIGTIGRTDKKYVQPMIDSILRFVSNHPNNSFNILYVGGSMNLQSEKSVKERFSSMPNLKLTFTGIQFPLSIDMIRQMDVCIASAGSCWTSYNCGIPTICLDGNDSKAIGIFKETTNNNLFRNENEPPIEIECLLEEILIQKCYPQKDEIKSVEVDFSPHWDFIKQMSKTKDYFDIGQIKFPFMRRLKARFLGFYYGLKSGGLANRCIGFLIKSIH